MEFQVLLTAVRANNAETIDQYKAELIAKVTHRLGRDLSGPEVNSILTPALEMLTILVTQAGVSAEEFASIESQQLSSLVESIGGRVPDVEVESAPVPVEGAGTNLGSGELDAPPVGLSAVTLVTTPSAVPSDVSVATNPRLSALVELGINADVISQLSSVNISEDSITQLQKILTKMKHCHFYKIEGVASNDQKWTISELSYQDLCYVNRDLPSIPTVPRREDSNELSLRNLRLLALSGSPEFLTKAAPLVETIKRLSYGEALELLKCAILSGNSENVKKFKRILSAILFVRGSQGFANVTGYNFDFQSGNTYLRGGHVIRELTGRRHGLNSYLSSAHFIPAFFAIVVSLPLLLYFAPVVALVVAPSSVALALLSLFLKYRINSYLHGTRTDSVLISSWALLQAAAASDNPKLYSKIASAYPIMNFQFDYQYRRSNHPVFFAAVTGNEQIMRKICERSNRVSSVGSLHRLRDSESHDLAYHAAISRNPRAISLAQQLIAPPAPRASRSPSGLRPTMPVTRVGVTATVASPSAADAHGLELPSLRSATAR